jgi:hypothetical protein
MNMLIVSSLLCQMLKLNVIHLNISQMFAFIHFELWNED